MTGPAFPDAVPAYVQAWVRQLLDEAFLTQLRSAGTRQVEVRLVAHKGRVRRRPGLLVDLGPQEMVEPDQA